MRIEESYFWLMMCVFSLQLLLLFSVVVWLALGRSRTWQPSDRLLQSLFFRWCYIVTPVKWMRKTWRVGVNHTWRWGCWLLKFSILYCTLLTSFFLQVLSFFFFSPVYSSYRFFSIVICFLAVSLPVWAFMFLVVVAVNLSKESRRKSVPYRNTPDQL